MNNDQKAQNILDQVQTSLKRSDDAIASSQAHLKKLDEDLQKADEEYEKAQAAIDEDIKKTVLDMDETTVRFVKDTE